MSTEREIRLRLNDLHMSITDVLERMDEHAYVDAEETLDHMQADIRHLRDDVVSLDCVQLLVGSRQLVAM